MEGRIDETVHNIVLCKLASNKKYKEELLKAILIAICAMLNSNGGRVVLYYDTCKCDLVAYRVSLLIRILEQTLIATIGSNQTVSNVYFKPDKEKIIILVKKVDCQITINYNLYLPSQSQVVQVFPWEPLEKVKDDVITRKVVQEPVQLGSHHKRFLKGEICGFHESKEIMFKNVKADASKRTRLADRITSKGNKFSCYVSAFANHNGGCMYYGITDDQVVEGELIPNGKDKDEIIKKVEKTINKMIWPKQIGQPKREEHWDILFEPVVDNNFNEIPSIYVIVIYIAPCLGGVFTEEPECYEMIDGKVTKMSYTIWVIRIMRESYEVVNRKADMSFPISRKRILQLAVEIPAVVQRVKWSSSSTERHCTEVDERLMMVINNGKWNEFLKVANLFERKYPEVDVKLVVLSKKVMERYRMGCVSKAYCILENYKELLPKADNKLIFEAIYLYLKAALKRAERDFKAAKEILNYALLKAEQIPPGLLTAAILSFAGMLQNSEVNETTQLSAQLSIRALEHLKRAPESQGKVDMEQKAYIIIATFHLGYDISQTIVKKDVNESTLETAKSSIMELNQSVVNDCPLSRYREVQFNLTQSTLYYRYSQIRPEKRILFLEKAFQFSKKAQHLAQASHFEELLMWANDNSALFAEKLVLASLIKTDRVRKIFKSKQKIQF